MFAIVGGSSLFNSRLFESWKRETVETPYGNVTVSKESGVFFLQRHGVDLLPPHRINHRANIWALKELGVKDVFAINSTGSLKKNLKPGTFLVPHDFFCPWLIPTFFDSECRFFVPKMDRRIMEITYDVAKESGLNVRMGGIYIQTLGPRFETVAEISFFKKVGDVVGMTLASEATLALECGMSYGSLCAIDNYCHGIGERDLTIEEVKSIQSKNMSRIERFLEILLEREGK